MSEKSKPPPVFLKRPGLGQAGRSIRVRTNFFEVTRIPQNNIIHFDVTITPEVPPRLNRKVFERFVEDNPVELGRDAFPIYDGRKNMFSHKELPSDSFTVQLPEDGGAVASRRPPRNFEIKIKKVNTIRMDDLMRFLHGRGGKTDVCATAIMALDVLIRHQPSNLHVAVGRSFYLPQGSRPLSDGLEVWQGYYQSARPARGRMMINVDLSFSVFFPSGPLIQFIIKILGYRSPNDLRRGLNDRERVKVEKMIKNLRIRDNHRDVIKRKFKITGLTSTPATHTYFDYNGNRISVADYFFDKHQRRLIHAFLPCVITVKNEFLPIEVCDVIERQRFMRKLTDKQVSEMMNHARLKPYERENKIREGLGILNYRSNDNLKLFEMHISDNMEVVNARMLPPPTIQYHPSSRDAKFQPRDGAWNLRDKKVTTGATLGSWSVLVFLRKDELPEQVVKAFIRELIVTCEDTGMNISKKDPPILHENHLGDIKASLGKASESAGDAAKVKPQLIVCVLPNTGNDLYAEIKRVGDTLIGVATQCVQSNHTYKPKKQYCANVCLKMNVKLGGMNSFLDPRNIPFISEKPTIIFGADMTHPGPYETERPSIAAVCASLDARASRYAATIRIQTGRSDIINDLNGMVTELLKSFYKTCGRKPARILFYRDGISDEQFAYVLEEEIKAVRAACKGLEEGYKPPITFAVVQKRHHTRFFPMDKRGADRSGNCHPGTVVETGITHPFEFDYYLQSHAGLLGTSRPAHYHVLFDENGFNADTHQTLSYNLCYLYARCTRSVSLVPPVYYADLVCTRARCHLQGLNFKEVKPDLRKVMYFM